MADPADDISVSRGTAIGRRALLKGSLCLGACWDLTPELSFGQDDPSSARPKEGDLLVNVADATSTPLTPDDVPTAGRQTFAWAMDPADRTVRSGSRLNRLLLVRLDTEKLSAENRSRAADGVVAYTAICTHTGCEVVDWLADDQLLYCPCHFSKFDPKDSGRVVDGAAPRALPALPLTLVEGKLAVARPFTSRVGFETA
jgi:rieske iron-sulfur protein